MDSKRYSKKSGLILTLLSALTSACTASDFEATAAATTAAGKADEQTAAQTTRPPAGLSEDNVRISRAFFERTVVGKVSLSNEQGQAQLEKDSDVAWQEYPTTLPAPTQPDVIADFRDRKGCAIYEHAGVKLCFIVVPDVTSLGVNSDEVNVEGAEAVVQQASNCPVRLTFERAAKSEGALTVTFIGIPAAGSDAGCPSGPLHLDLTLQQI